MEGFPISQVVNRVAVKMTTQIPFHVSCTPSQACSREQPHGLGCIYVNILFFKNSEPACIFSDFCSESDCFGLWICVDKLSLKCSVNWGPLHVEDATRNASQRTILGTSCEEHHLILTVKYSLALLLQSLSCYST